MIDTRISRSPGSGDREHSLQPSSEAFPGRKATPGAKMQPRRARVLGSHSCDTPQKLQDGDALHTADGNHQDPCSPREVAAPPADHRGDAASGTPPGDSRLLGTGENVED